MTEPDPGITDPAGTDPAGTDPAGTDPADTVPDPADSERGDDGEHGNSEAAKYRRRLRDTEAQRDQLAQQVEALQRAEAERQAAAAGITAAALWASGTELADLLTEGGTVDPEAVTAAVGTARHTLGIPPPRPNHVAGEGTNPRHHAGGRDAMVNAVMGNTS